MLEAIRCLISSHSAFLSGWTILQLMLLKIMLTLQIALDNNSSVTIYEATSLENLNEEMCGVNSQFSAEFLFSPGCCRFQQLVNLIGNLSLLKAQNAQLLERDFVRVSFRTPSSVGASLPAELVHLILCKV